MRKDYVRLTGSYNCPYNSYGRSGFTMDTFLFLLVMVVILRSPAIVEWAVRVLGF